MYSYNKVVRAALRQYPDGLTAAQIHAITKAPQHTISSLLRTMPDAYIDRWQTRGTQKYLSAVWCVVVPPENCPKPVPKRQLARKQRELSSLSQTSQT